MLEEEYNNGVVASIAGHHERYERKVEKPQWRAKRERVVLSVSIYSEAYRTVPYAPPCTSESHVLSEGAHYDAQTWRRRHQRVAVLLSSAQSLLTRGLDARAPRLSSPLLQKENRNMSAKIDDDENSALFYEVKAMMDEGDADSDRHSLSSDDEGYMERLMDGRTARLPSDENVAKVESVEAQPAPAGGSASGAHATAAGSIC